jgi:hypothetical protein
MEKEIKHKLHARAADVFASASRKFQPEYVLLWVVDEHGQEIEHEFIEMQDALAMVDPVLNPRAGRKPLGERVAP